jgi:hypothetical protein
MNFGQQIKWLDVNNKWHLGTVVATGGQGIWGVTHILNPDKNSKPECFVSNQGGNFKVMNTEGIGMGQMAYDNTALKTKGKFEPQRLHTTGTMSIGSLVYQEQYNKQRRINGR